MENKFNKDEYNHKSFDTSGNLRNPGEGYRILKIGEVLKYTDEVLGHPYMNWEATNFPGATVNGNWKTNCCYRRKIEEAVREYPDECYGPTGILKTPKDGYRFLKIGEKIQEGDLFPIDYECMTPNHWDKSFDIGVRVHARSCAYIRKVEEIKKVKEYPDKCCYKGELKDAKRAQNNTLAKDLKTSFEGQKRKFKDKIRSLEECLTKRHEESSNLKKELYTAQKKIKDLEFANNNMAAGEPVNKEILKAFVGTLNVGMTVEVFTTSHGWVATPITKVIKYVDGYIDFQTTVLDSRVWNCSNIYKSWRPWFPKA